MLLHRLFFLGRWGQQCFRYNPAHARFPLGLCCLSTSGVSGLAGWHLHEHRYVASCTAHSSCLPALHGPKSFDARKLFLTSAPGLDLRHLLRIRPPSNRGAPLVLYRGWDQRARPDQPQRCRALCGMSAVACLSLKAFKTSLSSAGGTSSRASSPPTASPLLRSGDGKNREELS